MQIIQVALNIPIDSSFDYLCAKDNIIHIGIRVIVPFGRQKKIGFVTNIVEHSDYPPEKLKQILEIIDEKPIFDDEIFSLLQWSCNYYHTPLGEVLMQSVPQKIRQGLPLEQKTIEYKITEQGLDELNSINLLKRSVKQQQALKLVAISNIAKNNKEFSSAIWQGLLEKNFIITKEIIPTYMPWYNKATEYIKFDNKHKLNDKQAIAVSKILHAEINKPFLLYGVTGSGKTEVYFHVIEDILYKKKQVLVLVPEISLTPQLLDRFYARYTVPIYSFHSGLSETERFNVWLQTKNEAVAIVIGTRSSLFLQFTNLGLIVVDEEHDTSYKQQDSWCYNARDLAILRANKLKIPIILGSATPSLESLYNIQQRKYHFLTLDIKAENNFISKQYLVDLKTKKLISGFADVTIEIMRKHLAVGNQILIFLNKRGFASVVFCHECAFIFKCDSCDKPFTFHHAKRVLQCHHCSKQKIVSRQCLQCGSIELLTTGIGTEQLEIALNQLFPEYKIARIDKDTVKAKNILQQTLSNIANNQYQILIGTQMLSKGHHFPNLTLAVVVDIDNAFFATDFRSEEKFAQLYIQVAGRAGRANKQGEILLQTHYPQNELLQTLLKQGYLEFAQKAMQVRQLTNLPPFYQQAIIKGRDKDNIQVFDILTQYKTIINRAIQQANLVNISCVGPIPSTPAKKAGQYRYFLLIQAKTRSTMQQLLYMFKQELGKKNSYEIKWSIDVNPNSF